MMNIKTTDKGAEIIDLIHFIIDDRNRILDNLYLLDKREERNGSLTLVEDFLRHRYRCSLVRCDDHIETLRNALDREHLSMAEALGVW